MMLRKRMWLPIALGAVGMMLAACSGEHDLSCAVDRDCLESELCHPNDHVCVSRCTTSAECPKEFPLCQPLSPENPVRICKND